MSNTFPKKIKRNLFDSINHLSQMKENFVLCPEKDFTRNRKLSFKKVIMLLISMGSSTVTKELLDYFDFKIDTPTASSLIQQRNKLKPEALLYLLKDFICKYDANKKFKGHRLIAVDGSKVNIPTNPEDKESYILSNKNSKGYNILQVNALYDLCNKIYLDATIQPYRKMNEHGALITMINRSNLSEKSIIVADRGYESYNTVAHFNNNGWGFVIRVKAPNVGKGLLSKTGFPINEAFDKKVSVLMTRRQTNKIKNNPELYRFLSKNSTFDFLPVGSKALYPLSFRVVSIHLDSGKFEYLITNLDPNHFSPEDLKEIYKRRWGIEISFRDLKHNIGMLNFHSKKVAHISQEIYAKMILYCFCEMITLNVVIKQDQMKKYTYQVNFSIAITVCIKFLKQTDINAPPDVEAIIKRYISPVRDGRSFPREIKTQPSKSFIYRIS